MYFNFVVIARAAQTLPHLQSLKGASVVVNGGKGGLSGIRGEVIAVEDLGLKIKTLKQEEFGVPWEGIQTLEFI